MKRYLGKGQKLNIDSPNEYYINCEDGVIYNKNKKMLGYMSDRYCNKIIYIKKGNGYNNHKPYYVNQLIYDHYTNKKNDYIKNKIKHLDGDASNCKINNLSLVSKDISPVKKIEITLYIDGEEKKYNSIQALLNDKPIITRYKLNLLKNNGKTHIIDDTYINYIKY